MHEGSFNGMSPSRDVMGSIEPDPIAEGRESSDFPFHENRVKPLLVAALVLAIAALTSVLAACYVITRSANLYYPDYHNVLPPCQQRVPSRERIQGISRKPIFAVFVFAVHPLGKVHQ